MSDTFKEIAGAAKEIVTENKVSKAIAENTIFKITKAVLGPPLAAVGSASRIVIGFSFWCLLLLTSGFDKWLGQAGSVKDSTGTKTLPLFGSFFRGDKASDFWNKKINSARDFGFSGLKKFFEGIKKDTIAPLEELNKYLKKPKTFLNEEERKKQEFKNEVKSSIEGGREKNFAELMQRQQDMQDAKIVPTNSPCKPKSAALGQSKNQRQLI